MIPPRPIAIETFASSNVFPSANLFNLILYASLDSKRNKLFPPHPRPASACITKLERSKIKYRHGTRRRVRERNNSMIHHLPPSRIFPGKTQLTVTPLGLTNFISIITLKLAETRYSLPFSVHTLTWILGGKGAKKCWISMTDLWHS
jgi:hypothetical protein